jgi:transposase InsO family protein
MDVTYVYVEGYGFQFQIDVQDYFSKYVLAQRLCASYSAKEGIVTLKAAVQEAERLLGPMKNLVHLVTDNGTTFVAKFFVEKLKRETLSCVEERMFEHIRIGYRRPEHIGSIERYHGSVKKECVYVHWFTDPLEAAQTLEAYRRYYNFERPHWGLKLKTPAEIYLNRSYAEARPLKPSDGLPDYADLCLSREQRHAA